MYSDTGRQDIVCLRPAQICEQEVGGVNEQTRTDHAATTIRRCVGLKSECLG